MAPGNEPGTIRIADGGWREWLCLDDDGLTVRNFLQTCRIGWHEVRRLEDGSESGRRGRHWWALRIVLHDGRVIIADGTSSLKTAARPESLAAIKQAAERHAVPAELTGMPPATGPGVITIADSSLWAWLRFDDDGIMVRNLFRTYRIGWEEVRWFTDGASALPGGGVYYWALDIVLRDGRVITATGTSSQTWTARPGTLTAIRQAAERHGVPAVFTARNRRSTRRCPRGFTTIRAASRGCGTGPAPSGRRTCTLTRPAASQQEKTAQPRCGHLFLSQTSSGTGTISLPGPGGRGSGWPSAWS